MSSSLIPDNQVAGVGGVTAKQVTSMESAIQSMNIITDRLANVRGRMSNLKDKVANPQPQNVDDPPEKVGGPVVLPEQILCNVSVQGMVLNDIEFILDVLEETI